MHGLTNMMRREAERAMNTRAATVMGIVTGYDPSNYAAKVKLQPSNQETGFIPIASPWVGDGWGFFAAPSLGDMVDVHFQEAGKGAPYVSLRFYGDKARPLPVPSGECWIVHQSGSSLKFLNDGTVEIHAATAINTSAPIWNHAGDVIFTGTVRATGDIWDNYLTTGYTMASFRVRYDAHVHPYDDGLTGVPTDIL